MQFGGDDEVGHQRINRTRGERGLALLRALERHDLHVEPLGSELSALLGDP